MNLHGKTALVTGSTSGIGLGLADSLAAAGAQLILNGFGDVDRALAQIAQRGKAPATTMRTSAIRRRLKR
ncbi:D-beta-hydroxybutyrate dehydrogenase [Serratia rubidaea]|uniref:D-beta-hydroxybutyrate dehydrogenase n=1 Tax=Serratia rubidaea TaxID=61652 RepID=A0A4U9H975_SERRU|nr:D-beta-hydroxybutyrate dehydrogenase [Serratia rubidaea]